MTCPHAAPRGEHIVRDEGAQLDFSGDMSYGDYLQLDRILNAQLIEHLIYGENRAAFHLAQAVEAEMGADGFADSQSGDAEDGD